MTPRPLRVEKKSVAGGLPDWLLDYSVDTYIFTMYLSDMSGRSSTDFAILGLLTVEPMSGYDVRKHFSESLVYFWNESYGQIYPAFQRLVKEGLIVRLPAEQSGGRERQVYGLTSSGRKCLREWLACPPRKQPVRNEFLLKLFLGRSAPPDAVRDHVRRFRAEQEELLAMFFVIRDSVRVEHATSPNLQYWMLALSHGIRMRQAEINWCNEALRILEAPVTSRTSECAVPKAAAAITSSAKTAKGEEHERGRKQQSRR